MQIVQFFSVVLLNNTAHTELKFQLIPAESAKIWAVGAPPDWQTLSEKLKETGGKL